MTDFVAAECAIRQLHARFQDAVWRKDAEAFANCFTIDGEWKIAALHIRGRTEIQDLIGKLLGGCERVRIILGIPLLEVASGTATSRVDVTEMAKLKDGTSALTLGRYYDRYIEMDGRWLFSWRHFGLHYRGPLDLSAAFIDSPDFGPPPGMPSPDEPTITRRPQ
jgi:uncharacterized protein (TIGR02246 family)